MIGDVFGDVIVVVDIVGIFIVLVFFDCLDVMWYVDCMYIVDLLDWLVNFDEDWYGDFDVECLVVDLEVVGVDCIIW